MKKVFKLFGIGILLGIASLIVQDVLDIPRDEFLKYFWTVGILIVVGSVVCNFLYHQFYMKKLRRFGKMLEDGQAQEYVDGMEAVLSKVRGKHMKKVFALNLSAGYADLENFEKCRELLEPLTGQLTKGLLTDIHALNLCHTYFRLGQGKQAVALYKANGKGFEVLRKSSGYGGNMAVLDTMVFLHHGEVEAAKILLESAREQFPNPRLQKDYESLETRLANIKGYH